MAINKIKKDSTSGQDRIHNQMLKNLPEKTLVDILNLFNLSLIKGELPKAWKTACITMIPKKSKASSDPSNYRPISVTSCLGKLLERVIYNRLYKSVEQNFYVKNSQASGNIGVQQIICFYLYKKLLSLLIGKKKCVVFSLISQKRLIVYGTKGCFLN